MNKPKLMWDIDTERYYYQSSKDWVFQLDDDKDRQFGILYEAIDLYEATGEDEFKQYPIAVSASIIAHRPHAKFWDEAGAPEDVKPTLNDLRIETYRYMGGVPVDHVLANATRNAKEPDKEPFQCLVEQFSAAEACVITDHPRFGTVAAQSGPGSEYQYLRFKTWEAAEDYIKYLAEYRTGAMGMMIGFTLDRPINLAGETGWSVMEYQVTGKRSR